MLPNPIIMRVRSSKTLYIINRNCLKDWKYQQILNHVIKKPYSSIY